jgi:crotonobetainyl-CoA:carnitine CoA-transferase CaiB-like acyl-CoA transferase
MQDSAMMNPALLSGLRVLDLSIWRPGPYATSLLVALGADVLKVEPPGGDPMRQYGALFESINAGKRSIELDLKDGDGRERALALAKEADVFVEGFRPGVMTRLGLDADTVRRAHPALVYCSISGYGQDDPRAELPGHDVNYQAWAGALAPEGGAGRVSPLPIADLAGGMAAAFGVCAAVLGRHATGEGTYLDVSMTDVLATWTGRIGSTDGDSAEGSSRDGPVPGYGVFDTADGGQIALGVISEQHFWSNLCAELGLDDMAALGFEVRSARGAEAQRAVAAAVSGRCRDELVAALTAAAVPVAPVLDRRGMVASAPFPAFPVRLRLPTLDRVAPALDEHRGQGFPPR